MAAGQFSFEFVPESAAAEPENLGATAFKNMDAVPELSAEAAERFVTDVDSILPRATSLSEIIDVWGSEDGVTLQRWRPGGIRVRVDVANYGPSLAGQLGQLLAIARRHRLVVLLLNDLRLLEPELSLVERAMAGSRAAQWLRDPSGHQRMRARNESGQPEGAG